MTVDDAQKVADVINETMSFSREIEVHKIVAALIEKFPEIEWKLRPWDQPVEDDAPDAYKEVSVRAKTS